MIVKQLNISESKLAWDDWLSSNYKLPVIDDDYETIRIDFVKAYAEIRNSIPANSGRIKYLTDIKFGSFIYEYFSDKPWFTLRVAENDAFWRYLSLKVIPDIVGKRWGNSAADHFYFRSNRIWLKTIWWYMYLSWQGDIKQTETMLDNENCTTDTILNFIERSGRRGVYVDVHRNIIKQYCNIPHDLVVKLDSKLKIKSKNDSFFRCIMRLDTARITVMEPGLFDGGEKAFVKSLLNDLGVK